MPKLTTSLKEQGLMTDEGELITTSKIATILANSVPKGKISIKS
jgi:hypothetical protein